ncbi:hypothetical protein VTK73DRAFT_5128 [Phialemonium thermophilum]|uniref:Uncharacterized protein n=1 Tax=Phialemonium thermophilum TaxID=223376 RepID=A0ABR3V3B6_9PEZI
MYKDKKKNSNPTIYPDSADRFNGTLLPRPARYLRGPPTKARGLGNLSSSTNRHRGSCTTNLSPCADDDNDDGCWWLSRVGLGLLAPPLPAGCWCWWRVPAGEEEEGLAGWER